MPLPDQIVSVQTDSYDCSIGSLDCVYYRSHECIIVGDKCEAGVDAILIFKKDIPKYMAIRMGFDNG